MRLINGEGLLLGSKGDHLVTVRLNGGTAKIQYTVENDIAYADLPDSTYAADADEIKTLCDCRLKAVLTGDATIDINVASM
tara:strand:+ start:7779 stop:8021 length:243 start_codon:yes stop_codon:yes gene_type:complete